jgi:hypothetical protein
LSGGAVPEPDSPFLGLTRSGLFRSSGAAFEIPVAVRRALERIFGEGSTRGVEVVYRPAFVRCHLLWLGSFRGRGSTTRPNRIYTNLTRDEFFSDDPRLQLHLLHEFYHVVGQWQAGMTIPGYLSSFRSKEDEANAFAHQNLARYVRCGC